MSEDPKLFVARESDLAALSDHWNKAKAGDARFVLVTAPFGGGRRALVNQFLRDTQSIDADAILWRVSCLDQENGLQWLVRMYGALVASLTSDVLRRGKVEMILNSQLASQPKRVQSWFMQFTANLKEAKTDNEKGQVQLRLPQDNPLIGLVEVVRAISRKFPILLEIQHPWNVNSLALATFLEALHGETKGGDAKILTVLFDEPASEARTAGYPLPLLDFYERNGSDLHDLTIEPWGAAEVQKYLDSKGLQSDAARIATMSGGRPGFAAEVIDILEERGELGADLSAVTMPSLLPMNIDEGELDVPETPPAEGERAYAGPADATRVAYLAALLGSAFPANLVADMGGFDADSIDDLIDAMPDLYEQVQFSDEMQSWIYRFKRGSYREAIIEQHDNDEGHDLARRVGMFMERFLVPRGYGFIVKAARVYAEHSAPQRAAVMRSLALTNDHNDIWGLCYDLIRYFDDVAWPDALRRTVYMNLLDRLVGGGQIAATEQVLAEATTWATEKQDRPLTAWLLHAGSRLDVRRQDLHRARDRANDALKLYEALEERVRCAELNNHLATIELQDGNPNAAMLAVDKALELAEVDAGDGKKGVVPGVLATAEHLRGLVARRAGNLQVASEHFRRANEVAGQTGLGQLALDAGLAYGESLLAGGQTEQARDVLERVLSIAKALRNPTRERSTTELLAQAEGALRNFDKALPLAARTLELTRALKFDSALPIDLYNLGFFHFVTQKPQEALAFFKQAADRVGALGEGHPVVKELHYFRGLANLQTGQLDAAKASLTAGIAPAQAHKDWRKVCSTLENLATIEVQQGKPDAAKKLLGDAINFAKQASLEPERKALKKKLSQLEGGA